ncbi:hypothetical protein P154DRAFT_569584 [Amniculicola lignicola CBS 123094]|uniref:Uncharacterized protein n=1 Tax=Amniculicola lignicola CBS 123094 TaxID=1392246 RepID=A0A6A5X082_9PLEO|nr:hypothetical protein P154DRAFT_569584 [Amniculicola lignicola CBS 123094]
MSGMPLRPSMSMSMPVDDPHRSLPNSPYEIDPRDPRMMASSFESSSLGMDGPGYFSTMGMGPMGGRSHGPPFMPPGFDSEMMGSSQQQIDDLVRRTNLMVQFVNSHISFASRYSQLQPKMCSDAKFPSEFRVPRTVEEVRAMDPSTIDRILRAYHLPTDLRSLRLTSQDTVNPGRAHQAKLCTLFDFLGATQISERARMKRSACLPY